jgi:5-methylcytosine-specific restriction endonuclease McrA
MKNTTPDLSQIASDVIANTLGNYEALFATYRPLVVAVAVVWGLLFVIKLVRKLIPVTVDSQRLYTKQEKMQGFARAGGRCEMEGFLWFRCRRKAEHGDHHYPHSRGGATTMANFVAACARCNTSKGAKVPGLLATKRMESRRKSYFPKGINVAVGERITRKSRKATA